MADPQQPPPPKRNAALATLIGTVGLGMTTTLLVDTRADEGSKPHAYRDLGGVWTICSGSTHAVKPGEVDTAEQCDARTAADLLIAYHGVTACAPGLKDVARHNQLRAAIRFNNNTGKFCRSPGRLMRAGQYRAGCDAMLRYVYVKGRVIQGLVNRRLREHSICVEGLSP